MTYEIDSDLPGIIEERTGMSRQDWGKQYLDVLAVAHDVAEYYEDMLDEARNDEGAASLKVVMLREALEESNSLLAAMLHEERPRAEIELQISDNRRALERSVSC